MRGGAGMGRLEEAIAGSYRKSMRARARMVEFRWGGTHTGASGLPRTLG